MLLGSRIFLDRSERSGQTVASTKLLRFECALCDEAFASEAEFVQHKKTIRHKKNFCAEVYKSKR
jgi:hypothetical protein